MSLVGFTGAYVTSGYLAASAWAFAAMAAIQPWSAAGAEKPIVTGRPGAAGGAAGVAPAGAGGAGGGGGLFLGAPPGGPAAGPAAPGGEARGAAAYCSCTPPARHRRRPRPLRRGSRGGRGSGPVRGDRASSPSLYSGVRWSRGVFTCPRGGRGSGTARRPR